MKTQGVRLERECYAAAGRRAEPDSCPCRPRYPWGGGLMGLLTRRRAAQQQPLTVQEARQLEAVHATELRMSKLEKDFAGDDRAREQQERDDERQRRRQARHDAMMRVLVQVPFTLALAAVALCIVVTIAGQVLFYKTLKWPDGFRWLIGVLPVVIEVGSWTFAAIAWNLQRQGLPYGKYTRLMWLFSCGATAMNGYHGAKTMSDASMAVVLGGPSLIGPFIWHVYLQSEKVQRVGRTAEQIAASLLRKIHFPLTTWIASRWWAVGGGVALTMDEAWRHAWLQRHGSAASSAEQTTGNSATGTAGSAPASAGDDTAEAAGSAPIRITRVSADPPVATLGWTARTALFPGAEKALTMATAERCYASSKPVSARSSAPLFSGSAPRVPAPSTSADERPVSDHSAAKFSAETNTGPAPRPARTQRRVTRPSGKRSVADVVAEFRAKGVALADITGPMVAAKVPCADSTARNALAQIKAQEGA